MTKKDYNDGIAAYLEASNKKTYSTETKNLHKKYIQPILDKASEVYLKEKPKASWSGSFFQKSQILSRVGIREDSIYREEDKIFLIEDIIDIMIKR